MGRGFPLRFLTGPGPLGRRRPPAQGYRVVAARREGEEKVVVARNEAGEEVEARGEEILVAAGRAPTVDGLKLENAGVGVGKEGLVGDERLTTTAEGNYAAGDTVGGLRFTHAAEYVARIALQNALFPVKGKPDFSTVPWTTLTDPEIARVGLTEEEARKKHGRVEVYAHELPDLDRAIFDGEGNGFVKIVTGERGRILGGQVVAPDAGDVVTETVLAMRKGLPITDLSRTVHVYPTISEGVKGAADGYYRNKLSGGRTRKALSAYFALRRLIDDGRRRRNKS